MGGLYVDKPDIIDVLQVDIQVEHKAVINLLVEESLLLPGSEGHYWDKLGEYEEYFGWD